MFHCRLYRPLLSILFAFFAISSSQAALIDEMNAAKEAAQTRNFTKLAEIRDHLAGTALAIYPEYWLISTQLETTPESTIQDFLDHNPDIWLTEKLRSEWLRSLGNRKQWTQFEAQWPKLQSWEPGSDLHCYRLQLAAARNDKAMLNEARSLWFTDKGLPDPCAAVFDAMFNARILDQEDVWTRIRMAFAANHADFAEALVPRLKRAEGLDAKRIRLATQKPDKYLSKPDLATRGGREIAIYALMMVARKDAEAGMIHLKRIRDRLSQDDRLYAITRIATSAARQRLPIALDWYAAGKQTGLSTEEAEWWVRAALRQGDWDAIGNALDHLPQARQDEQGWQYWRARVLEAKGKMVEANQYLSALAGAQNYYGLLAREELGAVADVTSGRYRPSEAEIQAVRIRPGIERALALYTLEWRTEAVREWNWSMRGMDDRQLISAAELARQNGWYDRAIYSAERTVQIHDFSLRYLSPYRDVTQVYARQAGLDEAWVYGLIRQESRFVSAARSGVGARGLMQVMPTTAKWLARKFGLDVQPSAINELGTNVQLGTFYLKHILNSLGNQPVLATAAYNAGPGRARAWQDDKALEGAIYVETIPFSETRDYVKKVMANSIYYARTFGAGELSLKRRLGVIPAKGANTPVEEVPDPVIEEGRSSAASP